MRHQVPLRMAIERIASQNNGVRYKKMSKFIKIVINKLENHHINSVYDIRI